MLPRATIPRSLEVLLDEFRPCFTAPTLRTFTALAVGLIAATRRRTVCGMLLGAGLERVWHHSRAHRFFALARWSADRVGLVLCDMIVRLLLSKDAPITLAVDDTLFKRSGRKVFGATWQHDGAAKGPKSVGYGTCFVVVGIVLELPFFSRPVCIPLLARLWRPRHAGKLALAREMAERIAARYPERVVHVVGDAAYIGRCRSVYQRALGSVLSPFNAFLLLQGIESLALRMERHVDNARRVAEFLQHDSRVEWVNYSGFPESPHYHLAQKYLGGSGCSIMTFGNARCFRSRSVAAITRIASADSGEC